MPINGKLAWAVAYVPGELLAVGHDSEGGEVLRQAISTTGQPAAIRLIADREALQADGRDMVITRVEIVDSEGRLVPDADNHVQFEIDPSLRLLGVGNGNPISHELDQVPCRQAYSGLAQLLVSATQSVGQFRVSAYAEGLESAVITLSLTQPVNAVASISGSSVDALDANKHINSIDGAL